MTCVDSIEFDDGVTCAVVSAFPRLPKERGLIVVPERVVNKLSDAELVEILRFLVIDAKTIVVSEIIETIEQTIWSLAKLPLERLLEDRDRLIAYSQTEDMRSAIRIIEQEIEKRHAREERKSEYHKANIPEAIRWEVWERDNFTCQQCGSRRNLCVDHIIPEVLGGATTVENCQTLCKSCNSRKGARI